MDSGDDERFPICTMGCGFLWGFVGGLAGFVLFIMFGVFALVPAGPFEERDKTLGIVLVVLGLSGISTLAGYICVGIPCAGVGYVADKTLSNGRKFISEILENGRTGGGELSNRLRSCHSSVGLGT
ncbi:hypothetical protein R1flu_005717 [Riccia fluitans]|uniref:Transmembrane protein n=1 Tax=Riccia fluitans TaxID=41844 RepID=A0ABD1YUN2_9MARC